MCCTTTGGGWPAPGVDAFAAFISLVYRGRRLSEIFPIPFLAGERALAIAIISYDGKVGFGLLGDYDALPDLDVVAEGIETEPQLDFLRERACEEGQGFYLSQPLSAEAFTAFLDVRSRRHD